MSLSQNSNLIENKNQDSEKVDLTLSTGCPLPKITLLDQSVIRTRSKGEKKGLKIRRIDWPNYRGRSLLRFDFPLTLDLGSRYIAVILLSRTRRHRYLHARDTNPFTRFAGGNSISRIIGSCVKKWNNRALGEMNGVFQL